jgi:hypothetical protein
MCEFFINLIADINTRGQKLFLCLLVKMLCIRWKSACDLRDDATQLTPERPLIAIMLPDCGAASHGTRFPNVINETKQNKTPSANMATPLRLQLHRQR